MRLAEQGSPSIERWFHDALEAAFADVSQAQARQRKTLAKQRTELTHMQDRLLNGYLAGTIDASIFTSKSRDGKREAGEVERQLDQAEGFNPALGQTALTVFDFSPNLGETWRGSKLVGGGGQTRHSGMRDFEPYADGRKP